MPDPNIQERIM